MIFMNKEHLFIRPVVLKLGVLIGQRCLWEGLISHLNVSSVLEMPERFCVLAITFAKVHVPYAVKVLCHCHKSISLLELLISTDILQGFFMMWDIIQFSRNTKIVQRLVKLLGMKWIVLKTLQLRTSHFKKWFGDELLTRERGGV